MEVKYNELSLEELKKLNGAKLTLEDTELLDENPNVESYEICGYSGLYAGYNWLSYILVDGTEIDIYYK